MRQYPALLFLSLFCAVTQVSAQDTPAPFDLQTQSWNARWISVPETGAHDYGVYYFRKNIDLPAVPGRYVVHGRAITGTSCLSMSSWFPWARPRVT